MPPAMSGASLDRPPAGQVQAEPLQVSLAALFVCFMEIALSGFGGVLAWAHRSLVEKRGWLSEHKFAEVLGLCQAVPGGNIVNLSIVVGTRFRGLPGALAALLGLLSAPFVLVLGLHVSLRLTNSRLAIVHSLGTVFFLSVGTLITIYMVIINTGSFANQWVSFIAFLVVGVGGLLYVLSADRPSTAITLASVFCPLAMFYCVVTVLIAKPGTDESADPLIPFLTLAGSFGLAIAAMLIPLLAEFDVALGRTAAPNEA